MIVAFRTIIFSKSYICFNNALCLNSSFLKNNNIDYQKIRLINGQENYTKNKELLNLTDEFNEKILIEIYPKSTEILEKNVKNKFKFTNTNMF